ncbi:hypothetical protein ACLBXI_28855 [Bacillus cereus]
MRTIGVRIAAGYVDDETLILSRNHGIEIKSIKIITDKIPIENDCGEVQIVEVEVVEIEGVIVSKEKIKKCKRSGNSFK